MVGLCCVVDLEYSEGMPVNFCDWKSAHRRVVLSTYAAEAQGAIDGLSLGEYMRALLGEAFHRSEVVLNEGRCLSESLGKYCLVTGC